MALWIVACGGAEGKVPTTVGQADRPPFFRQHIFEESRADIADAR